VDDVIADAGVYVGEAGPGFRFSHPGYAAAPANDAAGPHPTARSLSSGRPLRAGPVGAVTLPRFAGED
jgi:hypothetical protein